MNKESGMPMHAAPIHLVASIIRHNYFLTLCNITYQLFVRVFGSPNKIANNDQ